ncbi:hypothetical protein NW768_000992 [Fusarium equiseti]|uniref:F-box domain-containing protein n=1 Tax=Fusarium equiseti TaxID=61235 RepID=A0ABQ8RU84_FUSEQ|nr:hypothetical protein NW768_000992 [Fusarium equiseti]
MDHHSPPPNVVQTEGRSSAPASTRLPPETLYNIFQYFCSHCCNEHQWPFGPLPGSEKAQDNKTLYNICLVSRSFRNVAQETLFHSFDPKYVHPWVPEPRRMWESRLEPFLRTVASRSDLARSVRALHLQRLLMYTLDVDQSRQAFDDCLHALGSSRNDVFPPDYDLLPYSLKHAQLLPEPAFWPYPGQDLPPPHAIELLSVAVAILPNLAHVAIEGSPPTAFRWLWDVSPLILDKLGVDCTSIRTFESPHSSWNLLERSKNLETLVTIGYGDFPDMPTVKHLHLRERVYFVETDLRKCINACSGSLVTLSAVDDSYFELFEAIDVPRIHDTLEVLHLDLFYVSYSEIPSLAKFSNLRELFLHAMSVYGVPPSNLVPYPPSRRFKRRLADTLPPNIVDLFIKNSGILQVFWEEELHQILQKKAVLAPKLQSVRTDSMIQRKDLAELFDGLGVKWVQQNLPRCNSNSTYRFVPVPPIVWW